MTNVRFVEWNPKTLTEADMVPGARYRTGCQELMALQHNEQVVLNNIGGPHLCTRNRDCHTCVDAILDWPAGTPDAPTWNDIIDRAPSLDAITVWRRGGSKHAGTRVAAIARSEGRPYLSGEFLGWLVID